MAVTGTIPRTAHTNIDYSINAYACARETFWSLSILIFKKMEYTFEINDTETATIFDENGSEIDTVYLEGLVENWIDENKEMLDKLTKPKE